MNETKIQGVILTDDDRKPMQVAAEAVIPHFHGAVADVVLALNWEFTDESRYKGGVALLVTLVELLTRRWAEAVCQHRHSRVSAMHDAQLHAMVTNIDTLRRTLARPTAPDAGISDEWMATAAPDQVLTRLTGVATSMVVDLDDFLAAMLRQRGIGERGEELVSASVAAGLISVLSHRFAVPQDRARLERWQALIGKCLAKPHGPHGPAAQP